MAYGSYDELWRSEFYNNVSAKNRVQDISLNRLELKVNNTYDKDEKFTTKFEAVNDDVINKGYLDTNLAEVKGQMLFKGENFRKF